MGRYFSLAILLVLLIGCASKQTQLALSDKRLSELSSQKVMLDVPFVAQPNEYCGPTALKMVLEDQGNATSLETLISFTYSPNVRGSTKSDMLGAVRRLGLVPIRLRDLPELLREINRGRSVVVFYNSALSFSKLWHFGVLTGYDLELKKVYLHTGQIPNQRMNLDFFYERWLEGDLWAMSVRPPNELPHSMVFEDMMDNLKVMINLKKIAQARELLHQILVRFPSRKELSPYREVLL